MSPAPAPDRTALDTAERAGAPRDPWQRLADSALGRAARRVAARLLPAARTPPFLYALYTAVLFVAFLAAAFPHELLLRRLADTWAPASLVVELHGVRLGWTLAYTIDELHVAQRADPTGPPLLQAAAVRVAPSLLGLLRGQPYPVGLRADLYGGTLDGTLDLRPAALAVDARLARVDLGRLEGLAPLTSGRVAGQLSGRVELRGDVRRAATVSGQLAFDLVGLAAEGVKLQGISVPDLHYPEVHVAGTIKGGRLELTDLHARGDEVSIRGEGNLLLQRPLTATLLNVELALTPAATLPDNLRLALNLVPAEPGPGGERRLRLYGTLGQPRAGRQTAP